MADAEHLNLLPGSHTYTVARLEVGQAHSITRPFGDSRLDGQASDAIAKTRRKLAHVASTVFGRVREKMPDRTYTVNTGVLVAADNRLYVCAIIERVE
jgi:hypothetical protein